MRSMSIKCLFILLLLSMQAFPQPRKVEVLSDGWEFIKKELSVGEALAHRGGVWDSVRVPHDWAIAGPFDLNQDLQFDRIIENGDTEAKLYTGRTGALPSSGIGWYRRKLVSFKKPGKRIYVEFDGVMSNAQVFLNGTFVGGRPYGYSSFSLDLTPYYDFNRENILLVKVENKPFMSRFYTGAGIYRPVRLVELDEVHVAHWGTCVTTPEITSKHGRVEVSTTVENHGKAKSIRLEKDLYDSRGIRVAHTVSNGKVDGDVDFKQSCKVARPLLWSPRNPVLYTAVTRVYADGLLRDSVSTRFGFRALSFDKDKGFFLNGESLKLKGVCLHHDLGPLGAAVNKRAIERQLEMLKDMGCNAIRTSHNPPAVELLDLCDEMGFMVQVEAFDEWRNGKCKNGYHRFFDEWAERDLVDLIHRDRNHPCVIMWSIGNEVREQDMGNGGETARFLADIVRREDPTRPSTAGFNNHWKAIENGLADAVDLVGFNYKHFDYAKQHDEHPDYILYGSETSSSVSSRGVYKFPMKDNWTPWYHDYQVSGYDMDYVPWGSAPDTEFAQQDDHEFLLGEFVWTGFDYLGEPSPYGEGAPSRSSYFGIIDLAGLKKDRFYLYKSVWSDEPVLHVSPHWTWPDRMGMPVPVQCYTNYPKVELFVNGVGHGIRTKDASGKFTRYRMVWEDVKYEPGEIKVVAYDESGEPCEERVVRTAGEPCRIRLTADRSRIKAGADDLAFITVEVLDKEGNLCPRDASMLFFRVEGGGRLRALCNGDATDLTSFSSNYMRTFGGKLVAVVESGTEPGEVKVIATGERLKSGTVTLKIE